MTDSPGNPRPDQPPISQTPWSTGLQDLQSWEREQQARREQGGRPAPEQQQAPGVPGQPARPDQQAPGHQAPTEPAPPGNPFTRPGARRGRFADDPGVPDNAAPVTPRRSAVEPPAAPAGPAAPQSGPQQSGSQPSGSRPSGTTQSGPTSYGPPAPQGQPWQRQPGAPVPPAGPPQAQPPHRPVAPQPVGDSRSTTPSTPPRRTGATSASPAVAPRSAPSAPMPRSAPSAGTPYRQQPSGAPRSQPSGPTHQPSAPQAPREQTSRPQAPQQQTPQQQSPQHQPSAPQPPTQGQAAGPQPTPTAQPGPYPHQPSPPDQAYQPTPAVLPGQANAPAQGAVGIAPQSYSASDLIDHLNPQTPSKARKGLRGRLGLAPSGREQAEHADEEIVRTPFDRPVTVMIANPKGGVGKTPTTLMLAAAFGVVRGGGVVAWDNNELRGTMPDRSLSPHRRTVRDILEASEHLRAPQSQFTDLSYFLNHQTTGKFHTLGSAQNFGHVISREDFELIHGILTRYFQIVVVDTGNNEASPNWLAAAHSADCLVVPTKWRKDSLIPAARMLETLQEERSELLQRTVVVATNGPMDSQEEVRRNASTWFGGHQIVEIPTDPHVAEGGVIEYTKLRPRTKREMLRLAAQVSRILAGVAAKSPS